MGRADLVGPVKEARAATLLQKLLVVGDAALGEPARVPDPGQRERWVIIGPRVSAGEDGRGAQVALLRAGGGPVHV